MPDSHPPEEERYIPGTPSPFPSILRHSTQPQQQQQQQHQTSQSKEQQQRHGAEQDTAPQLARKRQRLSSNKNRLTLPLRSTSTTNPPSPSDLKLTSYSVANDSNEMSDGSMSRRSSRTPASANRESENEARALRVLEIMNDFRTLQVHITSMCTRPEANPPDQASYNLDGYALLRQCNAEAQAILATNYNPGSLGLGSGGRVPDTEVQKATLQRIILDASTRRFQAHKIYLRAAAAMRWVQLRQQIASGNYSPGKKAQALVQIDARLRSEKDEISDESVVNDLRGADRRKNYWLDEDPSLERMLAWIRRQR